MTEAEKWPRLSHAAEGQLNISKPELGKLSNEAMCTNSAK